MVPVKIIIYSDYLCPFCFLGKELVKRLQKKFELNILWKPYELHPNIAQNLPNFDSGYIQMMWANVKRIAQAYEVEINLPKYIAPSRKALKTAEFARKFNNDKFEECHDRIFNAYFLEGKNINKDEVLLNIIEEIGLDPIELKEAWNDKTFLKIIRKSIKELHSVGITGVPAFFIGNEEPRIVVGAQPQELLERVIKKSFGEI